MRIRTAAATSVFLIAGAVVACTATQPTPGAPPPPTGPASSYPEATPPGQQLYRVDSVYDGDTLRVYEPSGDSVPVRVLGIDAPEMKAPRPPGDATRSDAPSSGPECGAVQARDIARELLSGKSVVLTEDPEQPGTDVYGRMLRYVSVDGRDLGEALLHSGWVWVYTEYPVQKTPHYSNVQANAQASESGGWAVCGWSQ